MNEKQLVTWIKHLIASGSLEKFYNSKRYWIPLRLQVLKEQNYECQRCKAKGLYVPATTVHHIKPVRRFPELALTKGNLEALCAECHYEEHHKKSPDRITPERW